MDTQKIYKELNRASKEANTKEFIYVLEMWGLNWFVDDFYFNNKRVELNYQVQEGELEKLIKEHKIKKQEELECDDPIEISRTKYIIL